MRAHQLRSTSNSPLHTASAAEVLKSFNTWAFKREQPSDPARLYDTVAAKVSTADPIEFVAYWGKGPRSQVGTPEAECIDYLDSMIARISKTYLPGAHFHLLFTDTHALHNGHSRLSMDAYYDAMAELIARRSPKFGISRLSELVGDANSNVVSEPDSDVLQTLIPSAQKWFKGHGGVVAGATAYYKMNMRERMVVNDAFPNAVFTTFNGSELRPLFPPSMPIFYMYSVRKGVAEKPWFITPEF